MPTNKFIVEYINGKRDFSGEDLSGLDLFTGILKGSHPELFTHELSKLANSDKPVIHKPLDGVNLSNSFLSKARVVDTNFTRSIFAEANLSEIDGRLITLSGADLSGANLSGADLRYAELIGTNLSEANLQGAKLDHAKIQMATFDKADLENSSCTYSDFSHSSFIRSNLRSSTFENSCFRLSNFKEADIDGASFRGAELSGAKFYSTSAIDCDFSFARAQVLNAKNSNFAYSKFSGTNLTRASLVESSLYKATLRGANLTNTKLKKSNIVGVDISSATLINTSLDFTLIDNISIGDTKLIGIDLNPFLEAKILTTGLTTVDHTSIAKTISKNRIHPLDQAPTPKLQRFLESCGMPEVVALYFIDSIRTLQPEQFLSLMRSTFICYGGPDEQFAAKLNSDLKDWGVNTFFFPLDARFGEKIHVEMRRIQQYDRIILICSERSLDRQGLQFELSKVLEREAKNGGQSCLIPISLDDFLLNRWKPEESYLREEVTNRVVADFSEKNNYATQLQRLIKSLRKSDIELQQRAES